MQAGNLTASRSGIHSRAGQFVLTVLATAIAYVQQTRAYTIELIRWPVYPAVYYVTLLLTYRVSGRETVAGASPEGFLLVGAAGMVLWSSSIWASGYAIETERREGTILSLFLTPASRSAVVFGYALGSLAVFVGPTIVILCLLAFASGATVQVTDPLAVAVSILTLAGGSVALGYLLAGAFVLTRRANMLANFLQQPIFLLAGMVVPVADLPGFARWFAAIFPLSAGMDALRASLLSGAGMGDIAGPLVRFGVASVVLLLAGTWLLGRVEDVAKHGGELDFH